MENKGRNIIKFFVSNLPEGCTPWELKGCLEGFGKIDGTYVAKKRDKDGYRFGFVSFSEVKDGLELEKSLKGVKMGDFKLKMNIARFASENKGFARLPEEKAQRVHYEGMGNRSLQSNGRDYRSYYEVVGSSSGAGVAGVAGAHRGGGRWTWRRWSISIGFSGLPERLIRRYNIWGGVGLSIIILFNEVESASKFLEAMSVWGPWFLKLEAWSGQSMPSERVAWLKLQGIPLHILEPEVIESIGELFGKVLHVPKNLSEDQDLSFMRVGVWAGEGPRLSEQVILKWKDKSFRVWVEEELEEWVPDCLGSGDRCRSEGESSAKSSPVVDMSEYGDQGNEESLHVNGPKGDEVPGGSVSNKGGEGGSEMHEKSKGPSFPAFDVGLWLEAGNSNNDKVYHFKSSKRNKSNRRPRSASGPSKSLGSHSTFLDSVERGRPGKRHRAQMEVNSDPFSLERLMEKMNNKTGIKEGVCSGEGPYSSVDNFSFDLNQRVSSAEGDGVFRSVPADPVVNRDQGEGAVSSLEAEEVKRW
ncbi:putative RNA recognition motif domain, nucleotide-binding alpha-beta plait domain superfamily [Helianthus annuus]|nr:putative RNA recognition motif domain, nucleotide-binding alpha-beta plait domain superfamily [Helianthus annuus]